MKWSAVTLVVEQKSEQLFEMLQDKFDTFKFADKMDTGTKLINWVCIKVNVAPM